jgi:hypothetical protein
MVAKFRDRLTVSKRAMQELDMKRYNLKKLKEVEGREQYRFEISNIRRFAALESVGDDVGIIRAVLETVGIRVPTRNIRNFNSFSCSFGHRLSARCASAANVVCKSTDISSKSYLSVKSLS